MATQIKTTTAAPKVAPSVKPITKTYPSAPKEFFAFEKENYILMVIGVIVIAIGFAMMSGGSSTDPNVYNPDLFSTRRIVIAPTVVLIGYAIELVAILKKSKSTEE